MSSLIDVFAIFYIKSGTRFNDGKFDMNMRIRLIAGAITALVVGFGFMAYDKYTGREWVVSPEQIEVAQNSGQAGVETRPGTVAVLAIRREDEDILPFKFLGYGLVSGFFVVYSTRKPKAAPKA